MTRWTAADDVLCIRLDTIGDVLMTAPAMSAVKGGGRRVTLLTSSRGAGIAPLLEDVDDTIVYDAPWLKATPPRGDARGEYEMVERLRGRFDAAIVFGAYSQSPLPSALLCYLAGIPLRLAHCHENPYQLLTDWIRDPEPEDAVRHEVRRQLDLVAEVGYATTDESMSLRVPAGASARVRELLAARGIHGDRWVVVHPGASASSRRYPPESFAAVVRDLLGDGLDVVLTGTESERDVVEVVRQRAGAPAQSLAGELDIGELSALLAAAPLLISNNTGPVHIAAAVGTPVVDVYALTNPQHTPWGVPNRVLSHDVPCRWCYASVCPEGHHNCLRLVEPAQVYEAAKELLEAPTPAPMVF